MKDIHDLTLLIDAKVPIIVLETHDELRALELLTQVAIKTSRAFACWSITDGLCRNTLGDGSSWGVETKEPKDILSYIKRQTRRTLYALCDMHPFMQGNPEHVRLLKDIAVRYEEHGHILVMVSCEFDVPKELQRYTASMQLSLPTDVELMKIIRNEADAWSKENKGQTVQSSNESIKKLARNLRGVSVGDAQRLARTAIFDDGVICQSDIGDINRAKFELMGMDGLLSFEYDTEHFSAVGGLSRLKEWVSQRENVFVKGQHTSQDSPKGVMLLGVQGGGKSLAAKAIAGVWSVPILRLDVGVLYNKYIGESEKNLRKSLEQAELMSPCVLWVDEIEKGISVSDSDQGTSNRILGTLLTWMAERKSKVFIVATSNDVSRLPPELMRKGRLDEIFFVDLPDATIREEIFAIHLQKRHYPLEQFALSELAALSEGFSGAEIEQAIVSAVYSASAHRQPLSQAYIVEAIKNTYPVSIVMEEQISALRNWARERTVPAH